MGLSLLGVLVVLLAGASSASALEFVSGLYNIDIGGKYYDVTFHPGESFYDIWDTDEDGIFDDKAPMFWEDEQAARMATDAVICALADDTATVRVESRFYDGHITPWREERWLPGSILGFQDGNLRLAGDYLGGAEMFSKDDHFIGKAFATYELVSPVPLPAAVWLFGSALMGFGVIARRRKESIEVT